MNRTIIAVIAGLSLSPLAVAATNAAPPALPSNPGGDVMARMVEKAGGYVYKVQPGKVLKILDSRTDGDKSPLNEVAESIKTYVPIVVEVGDGAFGTEALSDSKVGAWVFVEENNTNPALLVAPEEAWARVNVAKLRNDNPDAAVLAARIRKEIWRGAAIAAGGSDSQVQPSLMRSIANLKQLDVAPEIPMPDTFNKMISFAKDKDFSIVKKTTYKKACKEGWAPAPTNDVQKAIWDKVHEIPKNPMKIEFDPKKGR